MLRETLRKTQVSEYVCIFVDWQHICKIKKLFGLILILSNVVTRFDNSILYCLIFDLLLDRSFIAIVT